MTVPLTVKLSLTDTAMSDKRSVSYAPRANDPPKSINHETEDGREALADAIVSAAQPTPIREGGDGGETSRQHAFLSLERALGLEHHEHHFVGRERCAEISIRDVASGVARFG